MRKISRIWIGLLKFQKIDHFDGFYPSPALVALLVIRTGVLKNRAIGSEIGVRDFGQAQVTDDVVFVEYFATKHPSQVGFAGSIGAGDLVKVLGLEVEAEEVFPYL